VQVLLVNNQLQFGGAETVVHQLWSRIPNTRLLVAESSSFQTEVMYPHLLSRLNHSRLHPLIEKWFPTFDWAQRRFSRLSKDPADIIHIHNFHGSYASVEALASLARTKRVVWTFHGLWGVTGGCDHPKGCLGYLRNCGSCPQLGLWPIGNVDRTAEELSKKITALAGLPLHVIAPSEYFYDTIRNSQVGKDWKVHNIPNGIDPNKFQPAQNRSGTIKILIVNRNFQDPHKGFAVVQESLNLTNPKGLELTFVGLNSGWAIEHLREGFQARDLGYITDREILARLYGESDIFLFASPAENFPCVILEAMASGCCVVATPSGGIVEQIADGENGYLAEAISGEALAAALARALASRNEISRLGQHARRTVIERFSEDTMIDRHVRLYQGLLRDS
jgi:glycosyltransferase involved in cell wall biosynthesis